MTFLYLDTETLGLDIDRHPIWEIAAAFDDDPVLSAFVPHDPGNYDPVALEMNGYRERFAPHLVDRGYEMDLRNHIAQCPVVPTLVGSNPAFDAYRLARRWGGSTPWHYRMIDVSVYAMAAMGLAKPPGLAATFEWLAERGHSIVQPDHTAAADVEATRQVFKALQAIYAERSNA